AQRQISARFDRRGAGFHRARRVRFLQGGRSRAPRLGGLRARRGGLSVNGGFLVLLLAMFGFMYFLLIRPQRQQQRRHAELLSALKPGDEVVTAGGIYGEVVQLDAERVMLEIDEDVRIAVARRSITSVVPPEELERLEAADQSESVDAETAEPVTVDEPMTAEERDPARN